MIYNFLLTVLAERHFRLHKLINTFHFLPRNNGREVLPLCYEEKPQNLPEKKQKILKKTQTHKIFKKVKTKLEMYTSGTCT